MDKFVNQTINLVHNFLLRNSRFDEIMYYLNLEQDELIDYINQINLKNNQTIPVMIINDRPKIVYHKREFKVHEFVTMKKRTKIMLVSDKHIDHTEDRIGYINDVYEEAEKKSIDYVFDLGDILNGPASKVHNPRKVRTGTLEGSIEQLKKHHPSNIPTYFITGNHDLKFMESNACDIGNLIEHECKNMVFLNNLFTSVNIGNFRINLSHGSLENKHLSNIKLYKEFRFLTKNRPHIICQGHFHVSDSIEDVRPFLYQVPSLKAGNGSSRVGKVNGKGGELGVIFLTIKELSDEFEIEYEKLEFVETKKLIKREINLKKTIDY